MDNKQVKVLAYYLPQFHEIPENNKWWGEGFTEWTNVKKDNDLSVNLQPLDDNYYDLLDEKTVLWQTKLAKEYGVYGFVYYHYYFCGKKLLEKPAENLLRNKHIDQRYCFCWANHSWTSAWKGGDKTLIKQEYGDVTDWQEHFDYLLPFFQDERYIKVDNKPLFILYDVRCAQKEAIKKEFNLRAKQNGFAGVLFAESLMNRKELKYVNDADLLIIREPAYSSYFHKLGYFRQCVYSIRDRLLRYLPKVCWFNFLVFKYNGDEVVKCIVENAKSLTKELHEKGIKYWFGAFSNWDNTPRYGIRGRIITPISNDKYIWYLQELKKTAEAEGVEFIFFNAWNEWAEGMVLEPDTVNKYRFLEGIKEVFGE